MTPRVTIGVAVRNGAPALAAALRTVTAQDVDGLEILVSDNASTDETPDIIAACAAGDPRVRVVRHETPLRALDHFHWVKDQARGAYFAWAAHDDARSSDFASGLARALDAHPGAVIAFGDLHFASDPCGVGERVAFDFATAGMSLPARVRKAAFGECFHLYGLWRRSALARLPLAFTAWWPDLPILTAAACLGEFIHVPGPRFSYHRVIKSNEDRAAYQDFRAPRGRLGSLVELERATWRSCAVAGVGPALLGTACVFARFGLDVPAFLLRRLRERRPAAGSGRPGKS